MIELLWGNSILTAGLLAYCLGLFQVSVYIIKKYKGNSISDFHIFIITYQRTLLITDKKLASTSIPCSSNRDISLHGNYRANFTGGSNFAQAIVLSFNELSGASSLSFPLFCYKKKGAVSLHCGKRVLYCVY
ncbi:hypothetical protein [Lentibacillus sediminis]|uniref:hypothetical protein n=1 Tax=Lentibacillus sediminis TaxID=1940529 RepID=UPI000C1C71F8|nr:hypothetical protein [Lentibacillus sediminis]